VSSAEELAGSSFLLLTTYRRNGDAVSTPVWSALLDDGSVGFWTSSGSGKAKRLAHTATVLAQPCDARGKVADDTEPTRATARLVAAGDDQFDEIQRKIKAEYGFQTHVTRLLGTIGGVIKGKRIPYGDRGVVVTPEE
jgi:uncharacterized protein